MIPLAGPEKLDVINYLRDIDCCSRCILRYLGVKNSEMYLNPEESLKSLAGDEESKETTDTQAKKFKHNPCRACLDIFHDSTISACIECIYSSDINQYNYSDFGIYVSFPKSILIRDHSIFMYLKEKFPSSYDGLNDLENLRKVFRIVAGEIISRKINKVFTAWSNFNLTFEILYEDDELDIRNIKNVNYLNKRVKQKDTSRNGIVDILEKCEDKLFKQQFPVPPEIPTKKTTCQVQCSAAPIWIGGRYLKFSRNMGQTPWIINNKSVTEHCLQDIVFDSMEKILGCDKSKLTFCASGREDADVRMLGDGRPFYIQIDDPKERSISFEKFREIEIEVFKTKLAAVIKLQEISKSDVKRIKDGERFKRKRYYALCQLIVPNIQDVVNQINDYFKGVVAVHQKTPMRVLHRRTQAVRNKFIYKLVAKVVADSSDLIELEVVTEAGTYVKEFVNGDFQRTQPSLSDVIQIPIDVVALDVINIELVWPEEDIESVNN